MLSYKIAHISLVSKILSRKVVFEHRLCIKVNPRSKNKKQADDKELWLRFWSERDLGYY